MRSIAVYIYTRAATSGTSKSTKDDGKIDKVYMDALMSSGIYYLTKFVRILFCISKMRGLSNCMSICSSRHHSVVDRNVTS